MTITKIKYITVKTIMKGMIINRTINPFIMNIMNITKITVKT